MDGVSPMSVLGWSQTKVQRYFPDKSPVIPLIAVKLVVVASGGGVASATAIEQLEDYFNGDKYATPPVRKRWIANSEITAINYTQNTINIVATVEGGVNLTAAEIESYLRTVFQPGALKDDGVNYEWEFGEDVPTSRIVHEIFKSNDTITKVTLSTPASDVTLADEELPVIGTVSLTINP